MFGDPFGLVPANDAVAPFEFWSVKIAWTPKLPVSTDDPISWSIFA